MAQYNDPENSRPAPMNLHLMGLRADTFIEEIRGMIREDLDFQVEVRGVDPRTAYRETQYSLDAFVKDLAGAIKDEVFEAELVRRKSK